MLATRHSLTTIGRNLYGLIINNNIIQEGGINKFKRSQIS